MNAKLVLALVLALALTACTGTVPPVTAVPTATPTEGGELVEPTAIPSPTPEPTAVPTEVPTPTPTEAPLYWECGFGYQPLEADPDRPNWDFPRGPDGKGLPTGLVFSGNYQSGFFNIFGATGCLVGVEGFTDPIFPTSALRIQVGFYDTSGTIHIYPVVLGGERLDGSNLGIGACTFAGSGGTCRFYQAEDFLAVLEQFSAAQSGSRQMSFDFIWSDLSAGDQWALTDLINGQVEFHTALQEALRTGQGFPPPPDYALVAWKITWMMEP